MLRRAIRTLGALAGATILTVLAANPAAAHVTVNPSQVVGGGFATVTFRVPNESDAKTNKVKITLPDSPVFAFVRVKRAAGWDYKVTMTPVNPPIQLGNQTITEVVKTITWSATSPYYALRPTEFIDLDVTLGVLPTSGQVSFPTLQYYDDGTVVSWTDPVVPGQPSPAHPAPTLTLVSAAAAPAAAPAAATRIELASADSDTAPAMSSGWYALIAIAGVLLIAVLAQRTVLSRRNRRQVQDS
jgi:uncharacterized protein YcnI